jgi:hypothetical protein
MWSKHKLESGLIFYYNAEQNKSVWNNPPPDAVVHEAPVLIPVPDDHGLVSDSKISITNNNNQATQLQNSALVTTEEVSVDTFLMNALAGVQNQQPLISPEQWNSPPDNTCVAVGNKRFKSNNSSASSAAATNPYLHQVAAIHALSGTNADDNGGKWLVR